MGLDKLTLNFYTDFHRLYSQQVDELEALGCELVIGSETNEQESSGTLYVSICSERAIKDDVKQRLKQVFLQSYDFEGKKFPVKFDHNDEHL